MPYYLEGMDLVEGQESGKCCGEGDNKIGCSILNSREECDTENVCTWSSGGNCEGIESGKCCGEGDNKIGCSKLNSRGECDAENENNGCTWSSGGNCDIPETLKTPETPLGIQIDELETMFKDKQLTSVLMEQIKKINDTSSKLYNESESARYIMNIKKMSLIDFGDPKYSDELDFLENVMINFIDLPDKKMGDLFKNYCEEDLNINILLTLAIFYNRNSNDFDNIRDKNLVKVDRVLNRLGRYLPDVFQKILTGMKMCDPNSTKYVVLEQIYKTMFKFNNTTVNLGIMDSVTSIFQNLKGMRTIEMIVMIMAIAFVVSKIFDMFRVKVEV